MKLSVIIPVYNQEKLIVKCLDSIPKMDDMEIIVVNDGSTDHTLEVINEYKKQCNMTVISYKQNKGVSHARNKALDKAKGDYILFMDSDDYIDGDVFKDIFENELQIVDMVFFNMIDNEGKEYIVDKYRVMNRVGNFKFIKRSFIGDTRFRDKLQYGEDALFHKNLMLKSPSFRTTNKLMYHYNFPRKGSLTDLYQVRRSSC